MYFLDKKQFNKMICEILSKKNLNNILVVRQGDIQYIEISKSEFLDGIFEVKHEELNDAFIRYPTMNLI